MKHCKLCNDKTLLQESHVIPKFVYKWMKKTGTGRFRQLKIIDKPLQDGIKDYLLCNTCEKEFGKREKWFKERVFDKYLKDSNLKFECTEELIYFAISVLWRVLIYFKNDGNKYRFKNELDLAESEWRDYLYNGNSLKDFKCINLVFIPENLNINNGGENLYSYFHRAVDIEIAESDEKSFVYVKFSRFIILGLIKGISDNDFSGTNIFSLNTLNPLSQKMDDTNVVDFIIDRSTNVKSYNDLSENQKTQNDKYYKDKIEKIRGNDYWNVLKKDINK